MSLRTAGSVLVVFLWSVAVVLGQYGWSVTYTTQSICTLKGSSVDLFCSYTYPSAYTVTTTFWFTKWGTGVQPKDLGQDPEYAGRLEYHGDKKKDCTLRITDLRDRDSAEYKFRFLTDQTRGKYSGSPGVTLSVTGLQVKVTPAAEGQKTLTCSTTCTLTDNPTYIWYKNGQNVQGVSSPMYSISSEDADSYFCAVKGRLSSPAVYKPKTSVSVSPSGEIVEGSSVTLTCSSDANPPVQSYTWWYKKNGGDYQSMTGPQHVFSHIQSSDSGEYYCESQNEMGTDRSGTINMDVKLEGSSVTLTCSSDANPPVDKYWYKQKNVTSPKASGQSKHHDSSLRTEENITVRLRINMDSSSVFVDVQYGPRNTSVSVSPSGEIVEGSSVTLTCSSDANPPVDKYTWYFQNETFLNGCGQMYNISNFKSVDSGHYHCEAWNRRGSRNSTALMIILPVKQTSVLTAAVGITEVLVLILCLSGLMWFRETLEVPLYSTVQLCKPQKQDVQYDAVGNVNSAATRPTAAQAAEEDFSETIVESTNPEDLNTTNPEPRRHELTKPRTKST
ncbi:B-cell receptor CD22-like [Oncorhynchus masou masou]|uniref:B-cell receptor CD22-like n=1 Tax=Oncorhynchus masou masou TaxID=90313 RepID=UPI003183B8B2